jgi:hypothetical protein
MFWIELLKIKNDFLREIYFSLSHNIYSRRYKDKEQCSIRGVKRTDSKARASKTRYYKRSGSDNRAQAIKMLPGQRRA